MWRSGFAVVALLAACTAPRAPDLHGAPERLLESELVEDGGGGRPVPPESRVGSGSMTAGILLLGARGAAARQN